jgi:AcrR family transcriptional regulator
VGVSPRPYNLGRRQNQIALGRRQILDAARALLGDTSGYSAFTAEAVARRADVARATVYYQFASKTGLLEAVCDDLADAGGLDRLGAAFNTDDPPEALRRFITIFGQFWAADRPAMRRLRGLAALDPDIHQVVARRDQRRRDGLAVLTDRLRPDLKPPRRDRLTNLLVTLTSFDTFDSLAGPDRPLTAATTDITGLALAAVAVATRRTHEPDATFPSTRTKNHSTTPVRTSAQNNHGTDPQGS